MSFTDRYINCIECKRDFLWSADEQKFYAEKNFQNTPKRCKQCRTDRGENAKRDPRGHRHFR